LREKVPTYLLGDPARLEQALDRLDELVFKPTGESGGKGVVIGPHAGPGVLRELEQTIRRDPANWIAQEVIGLSTVPVVDASGALSPRHVDLRPFAVFGETINI